MTDVVAKGGGYCLLATQGDPLNGTVLGVYLRHESKRAYVVFLRRERSDMRWVLVRVEQCGIEPYLVDRNLTSNFRTTDINDVYRFGSEQEQWDAVVSAKLTIGGILVL